MGFQISGTGSAFPKKVLTNEDLSQMVETNDEWIRTRVGVASRYVATTETTADLAEVAARKALEEAGIAPAELELIIVATITPDTVCPTVAGDVQRRLGATCPAFDLNSACSGFLFALETAAGFFATGKVKKALVIGAERMSKIIDWTDRSTCVIFGDGAGAACLTEGDSLLCSELMTAGGDDVIRICAYHGTSPFDSLPEENPVAHMEGQETFKFAVNALCGHIQSMCEKIGIEPAELNHIVPHQANMRIIQMAARRLKLPMEKFVTDIQTVGNTAAASVPIALNDLNRSGKLQRGDLVAMTAFGGGLSSGGCILRW